MHPILFTIGAVDVRSHDVFVGLGVAVALAIFWLEVRRRGVWDDRLLVVVAVALFGGSVGMRASGLVRHLDISDNPSLVDAWRYGAKSILGGLTGAYVGALLGKRIAGYTARTGDLFAPAVALGMAVGRIGCLLGEPPGRPTSLPWAVSAAGESFGRHPSFVYEIAFHVAAYVAMRRLRERPLPSGELLTLYLAAYALFRFAVEFARANETVWLDLTRPQWFLIPALAAMAVVLRRKARRGDYDALRARRSDLLRTPITEAAR